MKHLTFAVLLLAACSAPAQTIQIRNNIDPPIFQSTDLVASAVIYQNKVTPRIDAANLNKGLHFLGGGTLKLDATLIGNNTYDSILFGARDDTTVIFNNHIDADNSNDVLMTLTTGGRIYIGKDADLDLINNAYFTRQFWVYGDGTGTLELDEQLIADTTQGGTVEHGLGAIRLGHATLITHHTQSLPEYVRPNPTQGPGINGHMVFTEQAGGVWHVTTNAQSYRGGVWIEQSMTLRTDTDLTHIGVENRWWDYTMHGAFQTLNPDVTITKTGPASLILAGEQAYQTGATLDIQQGRVVFNTDAVGGAIKRGTAGQFLTVDVGADATAEFSAATVRLLNLTVAADATVAIGDGATVIADQPIALTGGTLDLAALANAANSAYGSTFDLVQSPQITGTFAQVLGADLGPGKSLAVSYESDRITATVALPGDANLDGQVNEADLQALRDHWQLPGAWSGGDFDGSGFIDVVDLGLLATHWQETQAAGPAGRDIPEPLIAFPLAITASQLLTTRRARP